MITQAKSKIIIAIGLFYVAYVLGRNKVLQTVKEERNEF